VSVNPGSSGSSGSQGSQAPVAIERLTSDVPDRLALWYSATLMMVDHPLTGIGPGQMIDVANSDPSRYIDTPVGSATSSAHNTILLAGAEAGVFAAIGSLLVNLGLFIAVLRLLWRRRQPAVVETAGALAVLGYLAQGMVNNLFTVAASGVVFAVVIGAYVIRLENEPSTEPAAGVLAQRQRAPTGPPLEPTVEVGDLESIVRYRGLCPSYDRKPGSRVRTPAPKLTVVELLLVAMPCAHRAV
jgi:hypothetical protein